MSASLALTEYQSFHRKAVAPAALAALQVFDERHAKLAGGEAVFEWRYAQSVLAKNWVGVIGVPGLAIEIGPKMADQSSPESRGIWQRNLIFMLATAGLIPFAPRDMAGIDFQRTPLLDVFSALFAASVLGEICKGIDRHYIAREERAAFAKGKLLATRNALASPADRHRLLTAYDEFAPDTRINKILKATARFLLRRSGRAATQQKLREILLMLGEIEDVEINAADFQSLTYTRANRRFAPLIDFCALLLAGSNPTLRGGNRDFFSLLFPMEQVFESFVAAYIRRNAVSLGLSGCRVVSQYRGAGRHLLQRLDRDGRETPCVSLRPDLLIEDQSGQPRLILDTKWKKLATDAQDRRNKVGMGDLYQIYAYGRHFGCPDNILLYPAVDQASDKYYRAAAAPEHVIRTCQLDLSFDLIARPDLLARGMRKILTPLPFAFESNKFGET